MIVQYNNPFEITDEFEPRGDQGQAISQLVEGLDSGFRFQTLMGGTGTGKTYSMAKVIHDSQRPALIIAHNKTLAAQLCQEFRAFFPENSVNYFISYYDYYQPEAYIPGKDVYIEKDSTINEEIERLRFAATQSLLERKDSIVIASVSCIFGLGSPDTYADQAITFKVDEVLEVDDALAKLVKMQFTRNDLVLSRGMFRVKGDTLEIQPKDSDTITRIEFFGDVVERIRLVDPLTQEVLSEPSIITVFPATHYVTPWGDLTKITDAIQKELDEQHAFFLKEGKLLEAQRIKERVTFDLEMIRELGYCSGVENYSRYFDGRKPGETPFTLLNFLPKDAIVFVDESHQTLPQIRAMYNGDRQRKSSLVNYGFRLPCALDNRPLKFEEFTEVIPQTIFVSATPGPFEKEHEDQRVEQIIRPNFITDPEIEIRPTEKQIDNLLGEIQAVIKKGQRILVTTLTKKMAEDLTAFLQDLDIKVQYLHSTVKTLERTEILKELREGIHDVVVGVNLLREGLDLPEVGLVAILDADKEGFLRSETSLIQTIGRAARNKDGRVILYADNMTGSMERAIAETDRRRSIQQAYNEKNRVKPKTIYKEIRETVRLGAYVAEETDTYKSTGKKEEVIAVEDIPLKISELESEMKLFAQELNFEKAAEIRDEIRDLKKILGIG